MSVVDYGLGLLITGAWDYAARTFNEMSKEKLGDYAVAIPTPDCMIDTFFKQLWSVWCHLHIVVQLLIIGLLVSLFKKPISEGLWLVEFTATKFVSGCFWTVDLVMYTVTGLVVFLFAPAPSVDTPAPAPAPAPAKSPALAAAAAPAKKARGKSPARKQADVIAVGTRVLAKYPRFAKRFAAKVVSMNQDGTCVIAWDDGDVNHTTKNTQDLLLKLD